VPNQRRYKSQRQPLLDQMRSDMRFRVAAMQGALVNPIVAIGRGCYADHRLECNWLMVMIDVSSIHRPHLIGGHPC